MKSDWSSPDLFCMTPNTIHNSDCIAGMTAMATGSVHLCVTSIPFEELFTYSGKAEDVGNNGSTVDIRTGRFALNLRMWAAAVNHVLISGGICAIHIQQLLAYKNQHGFMGRRDFRGAVIDIMSVPWGDAPPFFDFFGEAAIPKNPQAMAQRLNLHCLMFATGKKDSRRLAPAPCDFLLIFRKPGEGPAIPGLYDMTENPSGWFTTEEWIKWANGVWDIEEIDVLRPNEGFHGTRAAREEDGEKHVCPLQLELIRRCIRLWSGPGEIVLDPFMGIGSVAVVAMEQGRKFLGFELKESYHEAAMHNVANQQRIMEDAASPDLFNWQERKEAGA